MFEVISQALDVAKEHDLGTAGVLWIALFAAIAWAAGKGGLGAVKFVRSLLDTSTDLREQIAKELKDTRVRQRENEATMREQSKQLTAQAGMIEDLRAKLRDSERRTDELIEDLSAEREKLRRFRENNQA